MDQEHNHFPLIPINKRCLCVLLFASTALHCGSIFSAAAEAAFLYNNGSFTQFAYPGAQATRPFAINDQGDIVGWWKDDFGYTHGFMKSDSTYTSVNHPAAQGSFGTKITGINNSGTMVGSYSIGNTTYGFLFDHGSFTAFNYPGAIQTQPFKINNNGDVVGWYWNGSTTHGFLYSGGMFTALNVLGAISTQPYDINDNGQIVGYFRTRDDSQSDGFLYDGEAFSLLSFPASRYTSTYGINNFGEIVGIYDSHAFIYQNGGYNTLNPPLSSSSAALGINNLGQVVGYSTLVPEPTSMLLVGLGALGLIVKKSRKL